MEHRFTKVEPLVDGATIKTFFFRNFSTSSLEKELIAKFQEVAVVVDLFCPKKRDAFGKRFGFVRIIMGNEDTEEDMLEKLNSLWMDSYKLRVFTPRFDRGVKNSDRSRLTNAKEAAQPSSILGRGSLVEAGMTFANVTAGASNTREKKEAHVKKVCFVPTEEEKWKRVEVNGVMKLGDSMGLLQAAPEEVIVKKVEESLFDDKSKKIETRGGDSKVCQ